MYRRLSLIKVTKSLANSHYTHLPRCFFSGVATEITKSLHDMAKEKENTSSKTSPLKKIVFNEKLTKSAFIPLPQSTVPPTEQDLQKSDIKESINRGRLQNNKSMVLGCIRFARQNNLQLDMREYMSGLWACTEVNDQRNVEAFWIYDELVKQKVVPIDVFNRVMSVCALRGDADFALRLFNDFTKMEYVENESFLGNLLLALTRSSNSRKHDKVVFSLFKQYMSNVATRRWTVNSAVLEEVAKFSCTVGQSYMAVQVLEALTSNEIEPSEKFCDSLMNFAIASGDSRLLLILCNWYLTVFDLPLGCGTLSKIMKSSVQSGSPELSKVVIELLKKASVPLQPSHFFSWMLAAIHSGRLVSLIEAAIVTEQHHIDLYQQGSSTSSTTSLGQTVCQLAADRLNPSRSAQDEFYYALVDLVRSNYKVPKILLDISVMASSMAGLADKAFATFQEYHSLFGVHPDVHSYNGLLIAVCQKSSPTWWTPQEAARRIQATTGRPKEASLFLKTWKEVAAASFTDPENLLREERKAVEYASSSSSSSGSSSGHHSHNNNHNNPHNHHNSLAFDILNLPICKAPHAQPFQDLLTVLQTMEKEGVEPNAHSFTILFEFLAESQDFSVLPSLVGFLESKSLLPSFRSCRSLAYSLLSVGNVELARKLFGMAQLQLEQRHLPVSSYYYLLPRRFLQRVATAATTTTTTTTTGGKQEEKEKDQDQEWMMDMDQQQQWLEIDDYENERHSRHRHRG